MKTYLQSFFVAIWFFAASQNVYGQDRKTVELIPKDKFTQQSIREQYHLEKENKEHRIILSSLFIFYKKRISSQDGSNCMFYPSCSHYALMSIEAKGLVAGSLAALDRITRCNGLPTEDYKIDKEKMKLIDLLDAE